MKRKIHRCFLSLILIFSVLVAQLSSAMHNEAVLMVGLSQSTRTITLATCSGTIYDRNLNPINYDDKRYCGILAPELKYLNSLRKDMSDEEYHRLKVLLKQRKLLVADLYKASITSPKIRTFEIPISNNRSLGGLSATVDEITRHYSGALSVTYPVNGVGQYHTESAFEITNTLNLHTGGVQLTLDNTIQKRLEEWMPFNGVVIVLNAKTSEILACAGSSAARDNTPLLASYPCAMAFHLLTLAASMENGVSLDCLYRCSGQMTVGDTTYICSNSLGHHLVDKNEAFANSCDLYFLHLALQLGSTKLLNTAEKLGFLTPILLGETRIAPATDTEIIQNNFKTTPLHMAQLFTTIENGGVVKPPVAVLGTIDEKGNQTPTEKGRGERAISESTAAQLQQIVTQNTAQYNGEYRWFLDRFPAANPHYVMTILAENTESNSVAIQDLLQNFDNELY